MPHATTPYNLIKPTITTVWNTINLATNYAFAQAKPDGHFNGELISNATITAEYVMMCQALGISLDADGPALRRWFEGEQHADGGWSIGHGLPGEISTTVEAYLALKILGVAPDEPYMCKARDFVIRAGGLERVRIFTRIHLAYFGLFSWKWIPQLPPEIILVPNQAPFSIYRLSSWARATLVPLLVVCHHKPLFALPNGKFSDNDFLDELWDNPARKMVPYSPSWWELWREDGIFSFSLSSTIADTALYYARNVIRHLPIRTYALNKCIEWTLDHQETSGDCSGIFPPMMNTVLALRLEGYHMKSDPIRRTLEAIERFSWRDKKGMRLQACTSPVWDTILMTIGFRDAGIPGSDERLKSAMKWVEKRQILDAKAGDWRVYRPDLKPGGWAFEYRNTWYPDVDDTAAVVIAFVKQDPKSCGSPHILRALKWILGMQNADGGWAAFDVENDKEYLNKIPFSDMNALCDPSTADVTGRVVEAFGIVCDEAVGRIDIGLKKQLMVSVHRALEYLQATQELSGSWYGRWGVNYIYGTSNVLCALAYFDGPYTDQMVKPAVQWLKNCQQSDGGWGEGLRTYNDGEAASEKEMVESSASQTAWALMGLLAWVPVLDESISKGIRFLIETQVVEDGPDLGSWIEPHFTGTGFPGHFYLRYDYYRQYFPMMAIGRYQKAREELERIGMEKH